MLPEMFPETLNPALAQQTLALEHALIRFTRYRNSRSQAVWEERESSGILG